ncbi:MAG TPA: T9SS type A sorting domain-containing protein [Bacteroidia bacterium]|jgi:hypothetical protein|nr:T9SS type A sorting domain-containing protein [Bacteroidia bacterium]
MKRLLVLLSFLCFGQAAKSQTGQFLFADQSPAVTVSGSVLKYPWAGGMNSPILNEIDLNGDGKLDLVSFDRVGNRLTTYLNTSVGPSSSYMYAPEYIALFPTIHDWVRTVDFDCDGDLDLFTYTNNAMGVYRNDFTSGNGLSFSLVTAQVNSVYASGLAPVFVTQVNMPALADVDGDGDMDIVTFTNSGNFLEYHKNYSMDSSGTCNGLNFAVEPECWGKFKLSGLTNTALLNQSCSTQRVPSNGDGYEKNRHAGSVLTPFDEGCDGDIDLINGDILGENLLYLENGGTQDTALITYQDTLFPSYDQSINMQNLPAAYYMDVDNDGIKDMVVTPFATVGEDYNNVYFFKNTGSNCANVFSYVYPRFLIDNMIDIGSASSVAFFDVDNDGKKDIIAGNDYLYNPNPQFQMSKLSYFRNTGTTTNPSFELFTNDWLNISSLLQFALTPAFGDIDNDGDVDLLLGNADGTLILYKNSAGAGNTPNFVFNAPQYQGIDIGNNSVPQIIDVDRDGLNDILIGERNGVVNYYRNTGTSSAPAFTLITSNFGGVNVLAVGTIAGYSAPLLFDNGNGYELLVGSESGSIYHYTNIDGNLAGIFTLQDSSYQQIFEPKRVTVAMTDIDGDGKFDLLTGNSAGGFRLYTQSVSSGIANTEKGLPYFTLYPNPVNDRLNLKFENPSDGSRLVEVMDIIGNKLISYYASNNYCSFDFSKNSSGVYLVSVKSQGKQFSMPFIKK